MRESLGCYKYRYMGGTGGISEMKIGMETGMVMFIRLPMELGVMYVTF